MAEVLSFNGRTGEPLWKHQPNSGILRSISPGSGISVRLNRTCSWLVFSLGKSARCACLLPYPASVSILWGDPRQLEALPCTIPTSIPRMVILLDARGQVLPALEIPIAGDL